jgi:uncharacterized protein (DUF433 family)
MQLEDYFDFLRPDDIRVKGTRVGIETILYDFIYKSRRPEEIVQSYPTLTLEQVYATITYYLHKNVPNNTLPILFKEGRIYNERPWTPLFPRS